VLFPAIFLQNCEIYVTVQQDEMVMPMERVFVARMATSRRWPGTHSIGVPWNGRRHTIIVVKNLWYLVLYGIMIGIFLWSMDD
jgi:hypothetical protein